MADGDGTSGRPHRRVSADKAMEFMLELLENDDGDLSDDSDDSGDDFTILHNNSSDSSSAGEEETETDSTSSSNPIDQAGPSRPGNRRRTHFFCKGCTHKPYLHANKCFEEYHTP